MKPHLKVEPASFETVVIGVCESDLHGIGKNLVKMLLELSGFVVHDLGQDIPAERFIEKAQETSAEVIAISSLMSTTMLGMKEVIDMLREKGLRDRFKVIIGGAPVTP